MLHLDVCSIYVCSIIVNNTKSGKKSYLEPFCSRSFYLLQFNLCHGEEILMNSIKFWLQFYKNRDRPRVRRLILLTDRLKALWTAVFKEKYVTRIHVCTSNCLPPGES